MKLKSLILGSLAALGISAGSARAADLDEIAAFALNICDAVNAVGITISSADHCMKFSGEFFFDKNFEWYGGDFSSDGHAELDLTIEVMGDSDFGVTRGWLVLEFYLNDEEYISIEEIGISIGNATVLATGAGATIWNADQDETLTHLITSELEEGDTDGTGGVYVSITRDLGNGWSIAKAIECIDSCAEWAGDQVGGDRVGLVGVLSYDNEGITGHLSVLFSAGDGGGAEFESLHAGIVAELDVVSVQAAFVYYAWSAYWEANASIKAVLDMLELAGAFNAQEDGDWEAIFSLKFDAGEFYISKAFALSDGANWLFEAEVGTDLSDNLALAVDFSLNDNGEWQVGKKLTWIPGGGYEAWNRIYVGNDGTTYFGSDAEVKLTF